MANVWETITVSPRVPQSNHCRAQLAWAYFTFQRGSRLITKTRPEPNRSQSRWTARRVLGVLFLDLYCAFHSASHVDR